jgi:uncharacterized protein
MAPICPPQRGSEGVIWMSDPVFVPKVDRHLLDLLVCPVTRGLLRYDAEAQELISDQAGLAFPIRQGIPILLVDQARAV